MTQIIVQNFDWSETNKPLAIFIPNRGRGNFIRDHFKQFEGYDPSQCIIIVGNDGIDEDFSDLPGVKSFTIMRYPNYDRNGCFIRNYFIKRCLSKNILQKDPETELIPYAGYDWLKEYCKSTNNIVRPYYTMDVDKEDDFKEVQYGTPHRVHWGFLAPTSTLQSIRGYDEDFTHYGYEDTDLYRRLIFCNGSIVLDKNMVALHYPHEVDPSVYKEVNEMGRIFASKNPNQCIRNPNGWGEG